MQTIRWSRRSEAQPIDDERPLMIIRGGVFTTTANRMQATKGNHYWARNISISRSRTTVVGLDPPHCG
jgi:hypothetical protein